MYYIYTKTIGICRGCMKTIGYIYGIIIRVFEKSLTVDQALELIRNAINSR